MPTYPKLTTTEAERLAIIDRALKAEARVKALESEAMVETLAALSHEQWAGWTRWLLDKHGERHAGGEWYTVEWERQIATPYAELSEQEKEGDRAEARKMLAAIRAALASER